MDGIIPLFVGMAAGIALAAIAFIYWIYDPGGLPPPGVLVQHLRGMRAVLRIVRTSTDALEQMLAEARRYR